MICCSHGPLPGASFYGALWPCGMCWGPWGPDMDTNGSDSFLMNKKPPEAKPWLCIGIYSLKRVPYFVCVCVFDILYMDRFLTRTIDHGIQIFSEWSRTNPEPWKSFWFTLSHYCGLCHVLSCFHFTHLPGTSLLRFGKAYSLRAGAAVGSGQAVGCGKVKWSTLRVFVVRHIPGPKIVAIDQHSWKARDFNRFHGSSWLFSILVFGGHGTNCRHCGHAQMGWSSQLASIVKLDGLKP